MNYDITNCSVPSATGDGAGFFSHTVFFFGERCVVSGYSANHVAAFIINGGSMWW